MEPNAVRETEREQDSLRKGSFHAQTLIVENKRRIAYDAAFKLKAVDLAVKEGNREILIISISQEKGEHRTSQSNNVSEHGALALSSVCSLVFMRSVFVSSGASLP